MSAAPSKKESLDSQTGLSAEPERLSISTKAGYGAGGIADFLFLTLPANMALPVYSKHFGMDTGLLGIATAIPRLFAAVSDSIMGGVSDNARTRWGRRRPFILGAALLGALMLPFLWSPPMGQDRWGMFLYVAILNTIYTMVYSVFFVPYQALGYELSDDYDERTRVQAWKGCVSGIGFFLAPWFFWFCTREIFPNIAAGVRWLSAAVGGAMVFGAALTVAFCRKRTEIRRQEKIGLASALKLTFRNRPFLLLQGCNLCMLVGVCCGGAAGFYLMLDYVCGGDEKLYGLLTGVSGTVANIMTYAGMGLGVWASTRWGKRRTAAAGLSLILTGIAALVVFLSPRNPWLTMVPGIVMNLGLQSCNLMFASMTADICDEDELVTGLRREGAYAAVTGLFQKIMGVIMLVLSGFMPYLAGYRNMTVKATHPQLLSMKWVLIGAQGIFVALALALLVFYPISRERSAETRRLLEQRKRSH